MRFASTIVMSLLLAGTANGAPPDSDVRRTSGTRLAGAMICGPRCVEFVAAYYGKRLNLIELVRRMQPLNIEDGCSLDNVCTELKNQEINFVPIKIDPGAFLQWKYPVIVHLAGHRWDQLSGTGGPGHFAVWLPSSDGTHVDLWVGPDQQKRLSEIEFEACRSGFVVLTSRTSISDPGLAIGVNHLGLSSYFYGAFFFLIVCVALFEIRHRSQIRKPFEISTGA